MVGPGVVGSMGVGVEVRVCGAMAVHGESISDQSEGLERFGSSFVLFCFLICLFGVFVLFFSYSIYILEPYRVWA